LKIAQGEKGGAVILGVLNLKKEKIIVAFFCGGTSKGFVSTSANEMEKVAKTEKKG